MAKTKKFRVTIKRVAWAFTDIEVEVPDTGEVEGDIFTAKMKAMDEAGGHEFGSGQADYEVDNCARLS